MNWPHLRHLLLILTLLTSFSHSFSLGSCSTYSLDGSRCEQCIPNYHLSQSKCYVDILGCTEYNFGNICLQCQKDYILVNNYCCDRTCVSRMYRQQDAQVGVEQVMQQGQVVQALLVWVNVNYFTPLKMSARLVGISFQKYQDVTRFFLLYEILTSGSITYKRLIYDYQNIQTPTSTFILLDDTNLLTQLDFQIVTFTKVTSINETKSILAQFPTLYTKVEPMMTLIKIANLNQVKQYEIIVHNQNSFKSFYVLNGKTVTLYDVILAPESFRVFLFGAYADKAVAQFKFLSDTKALIDKNATYVGTNIGSFEIFNSSVASEPMKVQVYSQNSTSIIKTMFEIFLTSLNEVSKITLVSSVFESKNTIVAFTTWSSYFERQSSDINRVLSLVFSGYNSTKDIPSTFVDDSNTRKDYQWEMKTEQWKVFTKFHLFVTTADSVIEVTVVRFDFTGEYKINNFVKVQNVTQGIFKSVNSLSKIFTVNDTFAPYERVIEGWNQISQRMVERKNINDIVVYFSFLQEYKDMGAQVNITKLVEGRNETYNSYSFVCENSTHFMRSSIVNLTLSGEISVTGLSTTPKIKENVFNDMTGAPFFSNDSSRGITVFYYGPSLFIVLNSFNGSNQYAENLNKTLAETYNKWKSDPSTVKSQWDRQKLGIAPLDYYDGKTKFTSEIMMFYSCPTIPIVEYRMRVTYKINQEVCVFLSFISLVENGVKKFIFTGSLHSSGRMCNLLPYYPDSPNYPNPKSSIYAPSQAQILHNNLTVMYVEQIVGSSVPSRYFMNQDNLNNSFGNYLNKSYEYGSEVRTQFPTFRFENWTNFAPFLTQTPYVRYTQYRTDTKDNSTYMIVSFLPSPYYQSKTIPTYSGTFQREYYHVCPPLDYRVYTKYLFYQFITDDRFWKKPNISNWYVAILGKDKLYDTHFPKTVASSADQATFSSSLQLLKTYLNTSVNYSAYPVVESVKMAFKKYQLFAERLNSSATTVMDYMSILDLNTQKVEIVSTLPFFKQELETLSLVKAKNFTQIENLTYFTSTIGQDYQSYIVPQLAKLDQNINDLLTPQILKLLSLSTLANPTFDVSFKKVYFTSENLTNQTTLITYIVEIDNLTHSSAVNGENSTLTKSYVSVPVLIKYFIGKNASNVTTGNFNIYILQLVPIAANSSLGNIMVPTTVEDKVQLKQTVSNFTVNYKLNYYQQNSDTPIFDMTGPQYPYLNEVNFGLNSSQGTSRFNSLMSEQGRLLEDGEVVEIKYYPDDRIMKSTTREFADYSKVYAQNANVVLEMIQTKFKQRLSMNNLTLTVLMVEKLTDQRGFVEYHMLVKVNVTYYSLISSKQESVIHIIRFTYLNYKQLFINMGNEFLPQSSYQQVLTDIKAEPNLYFQPMIKVPNIKKMQSFLLQALNLINKYIQSKGSSQRGVIVRVMYFRNMVMGGFYKIEFGCRSGNVGIGYMLEREYEYKVLDVEIVEVPVLVPVTPVVPSIPVAPVVPTNPVIPSNPSTITPSLPAANTTTNNSNNTNVAPAPAPTPVPTPSSPIVDPHPPTNPSNLIPLTPTLPVINNTNTTNNNTQPIIPVNLIPLTPTPLPPANTNPTTTPTTPTTPNTPTTPSTPTTNSTTTTNTNTTTTTTTTNTTSTLPSGNNSFTPLPLPLPITPTPHIPSLQDIIFANLIPNSLYDHMHTIIINLRTQYSYYLSTYVLSSFNTKDYTDGQFFNMTFIQKQQQAFTINITVSLTTIVKYNLIVYRCNSTCATFHGTFGSLYLLTFTKKQYFTNGTLISVTNITTLNTHTTQTTVINNSSTYSSTISESFFVSSQTNSTTNSYFFMDYSEEQSVISIFQQIFNQRNLTTVDTKLIEYQKYLDFLKTYTNITLEKPTSKVINQSMINTQVKKMLEFVREKYLTFLNNSIVLMIVQNYKILNTLTNLTTDANYAIYMLVQTPFVGSPTGVTKQWVIYKISINLKEILALNYQLSIVNFIEFAKNGQILTSAISFTHSHSNPKEENDFAFGYGQVNLSESTTDADLVFTLNEIQAKYSSILTKKSLVQIHKLQLKNNTINYKLIFQDSSSGEKVKMIAVYQKPYHLVQVLNKMYMPNENFRQVTEAEIGQASIVNNSISLISQLHQQEINSSFMTITNIEVTSQAISSLNPQNVRYKIEFVSPLGKLYSSIVEYNPSAKSLIEISFTQKIQLPQDTTYRLNSFEQQHVSGWTRLQISEVSIDPFYQIVLNKIKANNTNYLKTMLVFKRHQATSIKFKIVYQVKTTSGANSSNQQAASTSNTIVLMETTVLVDPMNQLVEFKAPSVQLNFTEGFLPVLPSEIQQQDLIDLTNSFIQIKNFEPNQQMLIKQNLRKYFLDGMLMKTQVMVRMSDSTNKIYEIMSFRGVNTQQFTIWSISVISLPKFDSCSGNKSCIKCSDPSYRFSSGICFLSISSCSEFLIDITGDKVICSACANGFQLMDQKCVNKQYYPGLFE